MQDFNACEESIHVDVNDELRQVPLCFKLCDLEGSISQSILYDLCVQNAPAYRHLALPWLNWTISTER